MVLGTARHQAGRVPAWTGLALIPVGLLTMVFGPNLPRTVAFGVPAMLIIAGAVIAEPWFRAAWARPVALLGDASYSLYLRHSPVLAFVGQTGLFASNGVLQWAVAIGSCIVASLAVYRYVEKPLTAVAGEFLRSRASAPRIKPTMPPG